MDDLQNLRDRIDAEISTRVALQRRLQQERVDAFEQYQRRYRERFLPAVSRLNRIWWPRMQMLAETLEALAASFGETITRSPHRQSNRDATHSNETTFVCESPLAKIRLKFGYSHNGDVRHLIVVSDLEIIPVYLKFEPNCELKQALEAFDENAVAKWLDDRIVSFVQTYLAIHESPTYLADHLVEDPVARVRFPKYAAKGTLRTGETTYFFISPETRREFQDLCLSRQNADSTRPVGVGEEAPG